MQTGAARWQVPQGGEVLEDEHAGAEQSGVGGPALVVEVVDVDRVDPDQGRPTLGEPLGPSAVRNGACSAYASVAQCRSPPVCSSTAAPMRSSC